MSGASDPLVRALRALTLEPWSDDAGLKLRAILARHGLAVVPETAHDDMRRLIICLGNQIAELRLAVGLDPDRVMVPRHTAHMLAAAQEPQT